MNATTLNDCGLRRMGIGCLFLVGVFLVSCSSAPEPKPDPSKQEIRQDADRFFNKMGQEEGKKSPSP